MTGIGCRLELALGLGPDTGFSHDTRYSISAAGFAFILEFCMDAGCTIDFTVVLEKNANLRFQASVLFAPWAFWSLAPHVKTTWRYVEDCTHPAYFEHPPVILDELVSHFWSSAK